MKNKILALCLVLILIAGCKKSINSDSNKSLSSNEIFPMAIGNKWVWNYSSYDSSGKFLSNWVNTIEINKDTVVNGLRWFLSVDKALFANLDSGFCTFQSSGIKLIYKYPAKVGDSIRTLTDGYLYVISIDTMITTTLGNSKCYTYEARISPDKNRIGGSRLILFVSPGIGEIKSITYTSTATNTKQYVLLTEDLVTVSIN